jgi:hypothetical protein
MCGCSQLVRRRRRTQIERVRELGTVVERADEDGEDAVVQRAGSRVVARAQTLVFE